MIETLWKNDRTIIEKNTSTQHFALNQDNLFYTEYEDQKEMAV